RAVAEDPHPGRPDYVGVALPGAAVPPVVGHLPRRLAPLHQKPWLEEPDGSRRVLDNFDQVIQSWDLAFKDTDQSDYVVGQVWGRSGSQAWLLDMVRARLDFTGTIQAIQDMRARWPQAHGIFIEDKANRSEEHTSELQSRFE